MAKANSTTIIKQALSALDSSDTAKARALLASILIAPKPMTAKGIEKYWPLMVNLGHGIRRFNPDDPNAVKLAESEPCLICRAPMKFARAGIYGGKCVPSIPNLGYAHLGCIEKADAERDRRWAALDAARTVAIFDAEKLDTCACGHKSEQHERDHLENLLAYKVKGCDCTHFRQQGPTVAAPLVEERAIDGDWNPDRRELARINDDLIEADDREMGAID